MYCRSCGLIAAQENFGVKPAVQETRMARICRTLKRFDNQHTWIIITTILVTVSVIQFHPPTVITWPPTFLMWVLCALVWILQALDIFDLYITKIHRRGRILHKAGLI
jgi:hypothetical protein